VAGVARQRASRRDRHGQHFLASRALAADLVAASGVSAGDLVLDLGAGEGILAGELARRAARVVAVENDPRLVARLRGRFGDDERVTVVAADVLAWPLPTEPFRVVANLPFHRGTEILRKLLDDPVVPLVRADVVVQWGLAVKRASVWPSTLTGVRWGAWHVLTVERRLPPCVFAPPPGVDAALLRIERRAEPLVPVVAAAAYHRFVARGFDRGLRAVVPPRQLKRLARELGFAATAAPRDLDARQWASVFGTVRTLR
jgi:23S rRNA (adenine-N6)-dimethyltransferase